MTTTRGRGVRWRNEVDWTVAQIGGKASPARGSSRAAAAALDTREVIREALEMDDKIGVRRA